MNINERQTISGELTFTQTGPEDAVQVEGLLEGLPEDANLQLAVASGDCNQEKEAYLGTVHLQQLRKYIVFMKIHWAIDTLDSYIDSKIDQ